MWYFFFGAYIVIIVLMILIKDWEGVAMSIFLPPIAIGGLIVFAGILNSLAPPSAEEIASEIRQQEFEEVHTYISCPPIVKMPQLSLMDRQVLEIRYANNTNATVTIMSVGTTTLGYGFWEENEKVEDTKEKLMDRCFEEYKKENPDF